MSSPTSIETAFRSEAEFTQAAFRRWLDSGLAPDIGKQELLRGRIVLSPPARWQHAGLEVRLARVLAAHVDASGLGRCLGGSAGYELPSGDTLQPDLSFISNARWAIGAAPGPGAFLRIVPSLVVEILSPSTAARDRTEKLEIYGASGVDEYWIVDPVRREISVFHHGNGGYGTPEILGTGLIRSRVFPGLAVTVEQVFAGIEP